MKKSIIVAKRRAILVVLGLLLVLLAACLWEVLLAIPVACKVVYCFAYIAVRSIALIVESFYEVE